MSAARRRRKRRTQWHGPCYASDDDRFDDRFLERTVFLFFSNRIGCLGSLAVSALLTLLLAWLLGWL